MQCFICLASLFCLCCCGCNVDVVAINVGVVVGMFAFCGLPHFPDF